MSVAAGALAVLAQPVFAQTGRPARPFRALFGGSDTSRPYLHQLDLRVSLSGAANTALVPSGSVAAGDDSGPSQADPQQFYSAGAQLRYARRGARVTAEAGASASLPYYTLYPDVRTPGYGADAGLGMALGRSQVTASAP